jgi:hypothetical protein
MINTMSHAKLLDLTLDREEFTRHGMHLNLTEKKSRNNYWTTFN